MKSLFAALALSATVLSGPAVSAVAAVSDKTFPRSAKVNTEKVRFKNRVDITLAGDLYIPKDFDTSKRYPVIIVGHPFGGVKEQTAGLYAQKLAEQGFVTLAFDASFGGESGGTPRNIASPEIYAEDFSAAVDYVGSQPFIDRNRIGVIGICGSGGFVISAAQVDPRMKAVATVSMYDMGSERRNGLGHTISASQRAANLKTIAEQRWSDYANGTVKYAPGVPESIGTDSPAVAKEFYDYYRTPRGRHPRASTNMSVTTSAALMNFYPFDHIDTISPRPVLFIAGEHAHSRYFSEEAFARAAQPKELYIVPGAGHVDLYDHVDLIPFAKITSFFKDNLK